MTPSFWCLWYFTWISDMNVDICFIKRSMEDSFPVLRSVVIANVAIDRFWSEIMLSMSMLQFVIEDGLFIATLFNARIAANRRIGLEEDKKSWRTVTAGCSSRVVTSFNSIMTLPRSIFSFWERLWADQILPCCLKYDRLRLVPEITLKKVKKWSFASHLIHPCVFNDLCENMES